jgi:MoaA/NifB/PqqE/SkfB family radical SAM enzyme
MRLADIEFAGRLQEAGLNDVLMSVHGVGETVRLIHGRGRDNGKRQREALENLRTLGVPVRFNVTVVKKNLDELSEIAALAVEFGARVVNFLTFNPYFEWRGEPEIPFQVRHSEAAPRLCAAIDILTAAGIEANVRYFPICVLKGYEQHVFTGHQLPFDEHEWDYNSWYDRGEPAVPPLGWYRQAAREQRDRHDYRHAEPCERCAVRDVCDGLHEQYLSRFGDAELLPFAGERISDPRHFIVDQPVVVEEGRLGPGEADPALAEALPLTQFDQQLEHRAGIKRSRP